MSRKQSLIQILEEIKLRRFHYELLAVGSLVYMFAAMNVMLIAAVMLAIGKEWSLDPVTIGVLFSAGYVGMFVGAISFGFLADLIGRKSMLLLSVLLMSILTALCGVSWDVPSMMIMRFLAGIGLGGALPQPGVYISEYVPARFRGRFIGLIETSWVYGALLSLLFPMFLIPTFGWRLTFATALLPLVLVPVIISRVPESIRFLERKRRLEDAAGILRRYLGIKIDPSSITTEIETEKVGVKELWSRKYVRRTILLWILWAVLVYTYHGIFLWLPSIYHRTFGLEVVKSIWWTLVVTLFQIPGYYLATFLLDPIGRKKVLIVFLTAAGIGCLLLWMKREISWILLWSCVISFFNLGSWAALYTYTPELYPTDIRGTGSGVAASMGRLSGIIAPTLTGYLYATAGLSGPFLAFFIAHILAAISTLMLGIETRKKILEEIS